ncbi:MAG TPA: F0F1 ATP synthase subunit epsilon [Bacteroidota bacterium]|jgi:F-type H+-transporting ATPase subunit epsilon|nr:F0F1 ATP synthase subunit epsilon [Bacteroidota bacterium]
MAEKIFHLEMITPRKVVFKGDIVSFSAPGVMGGFQVLVNHAPMFAAIEIGVIKIVDASGKELRFATSGGIVEVNNNNVFVLAETIEAAHEIDVERAKAARDRAQKRLHERKPDLDANRAQLSLARAVNRLKVAQTV